MKCRYLFQIFFIINFLAGFAQEKNFNDFLDINFNILDVDGFRNDWLKNRQDYNNISGSGTIIFSVPIDGLPSSIFYTADKNKLIKKISMIVGQTFDDKFDYDKWRKINFAIYSAFLKKFGKPHEFIIKQKINLELIWKFKGFYINLITGFKDSRYNAGLCCIEIDRKRYVHDYSNGYFIADKTLQILKNSIKEDFEKLKPSNKESILSASENISIIQKDSHILNNKSRFFYRKYNKGISNNLDIFNLKLTTDVFHDANEGEPDVDGIYYYWVYQKGFIRESGKIQLKNKKKTNLELIKYFYDKQDLLRSVTFKKIGEIRSYWIEYNEDGYLSRVTYFKNNSFEGTYYIYGDDLYNELTVSYFDKENSFVEMEVKSGEFYFLRNFILKSCFAKNWFYSKNDYLVKILKLNYPTPNHNEVFKVKPKIFYNSKRDLANSIKKFKEFCMAVKGYREWMKRRWTANQLDPKILFTEYSSNIANIEQARDILFPIALVQVGKGAVKVINQNKQYSILKPNNLVLEKYQLINIQNNFIELKQLNNNKVFKLEKGKVLKLGKGIVITINGQKHQITDKDNFFGKDVTIGEDGQVSFKTEKINSEWLFIPPTNDGNHKMSDCKCYTKEDKIIRIEDISPF